MGSAMLDLILAAMGVLGVGVAALSGRLRRLPLSEPLLALVGGVLVGPAVLGWLDVPTVGSGHRFLHEASRLLLAISVMAVALRYPLRQARLQGAAVALLVALAMPAMAVVTASLSAAILGLGLGTAALLGAALCPTDPVLASSTVTGKPAEQHLPARDRQILSLESAANDGLALPLVLAAVAIAGTTSVPGAITESVWQVLGGVAVGAVAGWVGGRALRAGDEHGATEPGPALLFTLLLALAVLGISGLARVDGILAVFVAGLAFNGAGTGPERSGAQPVDEAVNRFLVLPLFLVLGAALPWESWRELGWRGPMLLAGVLLLRRLPVLIALRRTLRLSWPDAIYLGWFGPVGVSAMFYLTLEADRLGVDERVLAAGTLVVAGSTVVHGLTSSTGLRLYRATTSRRPATPTARQAGDR